MFAHLVWATYGRRPLISPQVRRVLYPFVIEKADLLRCSVLAIGGMPDHMHVAVRMHPSVCLSKLAQEMKGASAHRFNHTPGLLGPKLAWQGGYGAFSFWRADARIVVRYIETQQERHARKQWLRASSSTTASSPVESFRTALHLIDSELSLVNAWERAHKNEDPMTESQP
ncbi:MAG: IS200/IS605 family transposase [Deltaproteobacteria bacterium]|nr:IS200/IS605 family transposase [Deltaproteobacteria bacterium]